MPAHRIIRRPFSRFLAGALTLALGLMGLGMVPAPAVAAATSYVGGVTEAPAYVLNDHTPVGVHVSAPAGSLEASATYYLKIRFTTSKTPSSATNRGYTWNGVTKRWAQERASWTDFPVIATDGNGAIPDTWVYTSFGDERVSGTYYLQASLSRTGSQSTFNPADPIQVQVIDAATQGARVHNGVATGAAAKKRAEAVSQDTTPVVWGLSQTEANTVDDDRDGVVDDEDLGPVGKQGDYSLSVPVDMPFDVMLNRTISAAASVTVDVPDTDIALGAADTSAPSAPANLAAVSAPGKIALSWQPSTDAGGSGLAGYRVYRSVVTTDSTLPYTADPQLIGSTDGTVTSFTDSSAVKNVAYSYTVRAADAATNVSARSNAATGTATALGTLVPVAGAERYATAIEISKADFPASSVTTAVIATGKDFPDALAAAGLAGAYHSPVLLVGDSVTSALTAEIARLGATHVAVVGGTSAVSDSVLKALGGTSADRVYGADRYATAAAVARKVESVTGSVPAAFFVRGDSFADALAAAPLAAAHAIPILLVQPGAVPASTAGVVADLGIADGHVLGGTSAVSATTYGKLDGMLSGTLNRTYGVDRYATAAAMADAAIGDWHLADCAFVGMATGASFPDALGGGTAIGSKGGVLLLTTPASLSAPTATFLTAQRSQIDTVQVFGGTSAVSSATRAAITAVLHP